MRAYTLSPRISAPTSVKAMMTDVVVALLPTLATGIFLFGWGVLANTLVSIGFCLVFHRFYGLISGQNRGYTDPSPWVTGLLLALCFPTDLPFWAIPLGAFFSIVIVKELFGGFACNFVNPALGGWVFLHSSPYLFREYAQPRPMVEANLLDAMSSATPMSFLQQGVIPPLSPGEMFLGFHSGAVGEVSSLMLLLGGCYLLQRQVIRPTIPLAYLGTVAVLTYLFPQNGQEAYYWMVSHVCSGGLILGAFFMATDPVTSPVTPRGSLFYGVGCGILTVFLRYFGSFPDGVAFAILTMNSLVWWVDKLGVPRFYGRKWFSREKEAFQTFRHWIEGFSPVQREISSDGTAEKDESEENSSKDIHNKETAKAFLAYAVVLFFVVGGISVVHGITSLAIHQEQESQTLALLQSTMPSASFMSETPYQSPDFDALYLAYDQEDEIGYCVQLSVDGFRGEIDLLIGVDFGGSVTGISVLTQNESIFVGDAVLSQEKLARFQGRSGTLSLDGENKVDGISGATITLNAVITGVNTALELVQNNLWYEENGVGG